MKVDKFVILVLIVGATLRLIGLDKLPPGFTADEASLGYEAYSILKTTRDSWGAPLDQTLLGLRSFGDFKPPLYTYFTIPSVAIFGLTEFATRLPSALLGIASIVTIYLLTRELFPHNRVIVGKTSISVAHLSALFTAISPWHIQMSRTALEAGMTTFFLSLGIYSFLKAATNSSAWLYISAISFGLNMFSYHSAKIFTPVVVLILFVLYFRTTKLKPHPSWIIFLIFLATTLTSLIFRGTRARDLAVFNPTDHWQSVSSERYEAITNHLPQAISRAFNNKVTYSLDKFFANYLGYLSPKSILIDGPHNSSYGMSPSLPLIYPIELIFVLISIFSLAKSSSRELRVLVLMLFVAPLPAALAKDTGFAANRASNMLLPIVVLSAYGAVKLLQYIKSKSNPSSFALTLTAVYTISVVSFGEKYLFHTPSSIASGMSYGWKEAVAYINSHRTEYDHIVITRAFTEPQVFVMFYSAWDPANIQRSTPSWLEYERQNHTFLDQLNGYNFDKFEIHDIYWPVDKNRPSTLYITRSHEVPEGTRTLTTIKYPDGSPAFFIIGT